MWRTYIEHVGYANKYRIIIAEDIGPEKQRIVTNLVFEEINRHDLIEDDKILSVEPAFLQAIVDAAYDVGIKPTEQKHVDKALVKHLEDMRSLAFHYAKCEKP